ncbi:uncharacterized protein LOC144683498 [Cetorhinus maximus]
MPTSDTWAGQSPMDSIASVDIDGSCNNIDGSCNNVASSNSTFSDEHLDYLSAEERECLMFLEETIDSLDTEENNGVSTDKLERTEQSAKIGSMREKSTLPHLELAYSQNPEPDGKIPEAVSPNNKSNTDSMSPQMVQAKSGTYKIPRAVSPKINKNSTNSASPQMVRANFGANTLPKYNPKLSTESKSTLSGRVSESSRSPVFSGDTRQRSHTATVQHQLEGPKDEKAKLGPPTAPKPRKLPSNIILKSFQKNDGPMVSTTNSQNGFKVPKGAPRNNGYNLSRDNSTEGEVQQIRMEALTKLGLLLEPDGQKSNSASSQSPKTEPTSISQTVTVDNEIKTNQSEVTMKDNKTNRLKHPSIQISPSLNHSAAVSLDPGKNGTANTTVGNMNKTQLGSTKSSSLKRFTTTGVSIPPNVSLGSAGNISATTALNSGMSNTLPIARRSTNVSEGQVKNINTAQWQLGATKASSLKRFGTASDNSQPTFYSGITQNTSVAAAPARGLSKYIRPRPVSVCSEKDLSDRHGSTLEAVSPDKPGRRSFPIKINHISAKFQKSPTKGLNVQVTPQGPTSKDHKEALRKLGLLKE